MTSTMGTSYVEGGTIAKPDGLGLTASLGDETAYTDITIYPTGFGLTASLGTIRQESGYPVAGLGLTSSLGSGLIDAQAIVKPDGLGMTINTGASAFAWSPVSKGPSVTWTAIDKTAA